MFGTVALVKVDGSVLVVRWSLRVMNSVAVGGKTVVTSPWTGKASPGFGCTKLACLEAIPAARYAEPSSRAVRSRASSLVADIVVNGTRTSAASGRPSVPRTERVMTRTWRVCSRSCWRVRAASTSRRGSKVSSCSPIRPPDPSTYTVSGVTVATSMSPVKGMNSRGCRSKPSAVLRITSVSQMLRVAGVQLGTGRSTRRPVSCRGSATVKRSLGKTVVSGVEPVRTRTGSVDWAAAVAGSASPAASSAAAAVTANGFRAECMDILRGI
ncbi:MAG: hypothetical protein KY442_12605, partial [Proteobacteria bacterium]|nr:hypothetical protein [Pseudomonadota bacterium]